MCEAGFQASPTFLFSEFTLIALMLLFWGGPNSKEGLSPSLKCLDINIYIPSISGILKVLTYLPGSTFWIRHTLPLENQPQMLK